MDARVRCTENKTENGPDLGRPGPFKRFSYTASSARRRGHLWLGWNYNLAGDDGGLSGFDLLHVRGDGLLVGG